MVLVLELEPPGPLTVNVTIKFPWLVYTLLGFGSNTHICYNNSLLEIILDFKTRRKLKTYVHAHGTVTVRCTCAIIFWHLKIS